MQNLSFPQENLRDSQLLAIRSMFDHAIPSSVEEWLDAASPQSAGGLPLIGLPLGPGLDNTWGATHFLRTTRPDLPQTLLVIRLLANQALCVDIANSGARGSASATHRLLLVAAEARTADLRPIASILKEASVRVIAAPFTLSDLDQVVEPKMSRARRVRR